MKYFNQYLAIAKETGNKIGVGIVSSNIGTVYNSLGEYDIALRYFDIDLALAREIGDKFGIAVAHNNMANSYAYKKDFPHALKCFKKYLTLSEEIGYERGIGIATYNIAGIYTDIKKYDEAEQYFQRAEDILSRTGDQLALISTYINMSEMNERRNRGIKAIKAAEKALRFSKSLGAEVHRVYSLRAMGRALALQDVQKARPYLEKALTGAKKGRLTREIALLESDLLEIQKKKERDGTK